MWCLMKRPNILILYTDQQRWDALGANGNSDILTPNLDRLANEGVNFDHYFVQNPVCMPTCYACGWHRMFVGSGG